MSPISVPTAASQPGLTPSAPAATRHLTGLACGTGAGALWGLIFLAPALAGDFGPALLSAGRYLFYGLAAALLIAPRWARLRATVTRRQWMQLAGLSLTGNLLYYLLLSSAVQRGGIAMTTLIIGFLPVAVTLIGQRDPGAVPLRRLVPTLALGALSALCLGVQGLARADAGGGAQPLWGALCALGALASWTVFAVGNARCLERAPGLSAQDWNLLTGLVTGAQALALAPLALALDGGGHTAADWGRLAAVTAGLALLASIVGNALWNRASQLLPLTLMGQMIIAETLFALLYGFLWEGRSPTVWEGAALCLLLASVAECVRVHRPRGR